VDGKPLDIESDDEISSGRLALGKDEHAFRRFNISRMTEGKVCPKSNLALTPTDVGAL